VDLAERVGHLSVVDRCHCGESNCAHFYTAPKPVGSYGTGHENLMLPVERGLVVLDLVAGSIVRLGNLNAIGRLRARPAAVNPATRHAKLPTSRI